MPSQNVTVFEVLDNYFGSQTYPPGKSLNNAKIRALHDHIIQFYQAISFAPRAEFETRLYLGAFLSSPPYSIDAAPYISSALLYSDSIVLFDPLHYWFCEEQYSPKRTQLISASTGWRNPNTHRVDYEVTKQYLAQALIWYSNIRPLVDAGIIQLIPAGQIIDQQLTTIRELGEGVGKQLSPINKLSQDFSPDEITVDDNRKGTFVFAGGGREPQIQKWLQRGLGHFAQDVVIANATGALYTAPFRWEQHLGKTVLDGFAAPESQTKMTEAIRNLRLPILSKLSPDVIARIHKDSGYTEFRAGLSEVLRQVQAEVGSADFPEQVAVIEREILLPKVKAIYQEIHSSTFQRATNAMQEGVFGFSQTFLSNIPTGLDTQSNLRAGLISGGLAFLRAALAGTAQSRDRRIWAQLIPEKPELAVYGPPMTLKKQEGSKWEIDETPSMQLKVSAGVMKSWMP